MRIEDAVLSIFPPPLFLTMPAAGIDISQGSVKCVSLVARTNALELGSYSEVPLPTGVVTDGDIEASDKVADILRSFRVRLGVRYANASLSERKSYLYQVLIPRESKNLRVSVESDLETHVPLPPSEAVFDFEKIRETEAGTIVSVTVYAKRIVETYAELFEKAGITLRALEVESQSLARAALAPSDMTQTVMIIDFGRHTTRVAIAENGVVAFTATLDIGGDALTAAVVKLFNVPIEEAEKIKNERGFLMSKENRDLIEALGTTVSIVKDEVAKHLLYWNSPSATDLPRKPVTKVILCGGNANLLGFPEYLESAINLPVSLANVWGNAFSLDTYVPPMPLVSSLKYATAIGLGIRGAHLQSW